MILGTDILIWYQPNTFWFFLFIFNCVFIPEAVAFFFFSEATSICICNDMDFKLKTINES